MRLTPIVVASLAFGLVACGTQSVDEPDDPADRPAQQTQQAERLKAEASANPEDPEPATTPSFPQALLGTWRESDGPEPTAAQCEATANGNIGKVLNIRPDGFSIFENGGRFIEVKEREPGMIRAVFDTTYADEQTQDELTFAVDPIAKTLTMTNHDMGEKGTRTYKRCQ